MAKSPKFKIIVVYRDAITGHYVSEEYARRNPRTTVKETRRVPI